MSAVTVWAKPGSDVAQDGGCTCPVIDNCHGCGRYGDGDRYGWFIWCDCPMHGRAKAEGKS